MGNVFNSIQTKKVSSNSFDLSHDVKYSMEMGMLTPVFLQEVIPGDKFNIKTETLVRFAPLVAPVMHNIRIFTHYFFVPNRILWDNWEDFISPDLSKEIPPARPIMYSVPISISKGSLGDYFGLPIGLIDGKEISALPFAAYQKIYDDYYRDQNLQSSVYKTLRDGAQISSESTELRKIRRRAWQHDYFTSALPFAQKGPAVNIPMGLTDDVEIYRNYNAASKDQSFWDTSNDAGSASARNETSQSAVPIGALYLNAEETEIGNTTINDLRTAFRLQEWFEKAARGGSRYIEQLQVHFQVKSSDARLNRPEFLGGNRNPVIISEVLQTSETQETPQATMAGHALSANSGKSIRYYAEEHGYIIGIQSVMPSTAYHQGLPRHFTRNSWEDYAWPTFAHLGEQEILNKEIYYDDSDDKNDDVFGYIPRYSEYRYQPSRVAGEFRDTLSFWHMARKFDNRPHLNAEFIECDPTTRIFAVENEPQNLWCHSYHKVTARRKLPKYGTPAL